MSLFQDKFEITFFWVGEKIKKVFNYGRLPVCELKTRQLDD